jgi:hypothetical protein
MRGVPRSFLDENPMPTVLSATSESRTDVARKSTDVQRWLREPLLHFLLIGAALFAADAALFAREDDPNRIVVGASVDEEATRAFEGSRGRAPTAQELQALRQVWLDNEVLYREGLAMGLDKGDTAIRERVIFKALSMVDAGTRRPDFDEGLLRDWFAKNRARYDEPRRFDFEEAVLEGEASEAAVRAFVRALNTGSSPEQQAGLRVFTGRPEGNLVQSYGEDFARGLAAMSPESWQALQGRDGWRAIRLKSSSPARPAEFDILRGVVMQDWTDEQLAQQRSDAVRVFAAKYRIEMPRP